MQQNLDLLVQKCKTKNKRKITEEIHGRKKIE